MQHFDFTGRKIAVVGDLMLDRYLSGSIGRLSPEAPVAVLLKENERSVLGGAANVAANLAALGAHVRLVGVVGADEAGATMTGLIGTFPGLCAARLVTDPERPTTCKTRVVSGSHQIVRIDTEEKRPPSPAVEARLLAALAETIGWAEVVIVSDYAKGVCSDAVIRAAIETARAAGRACLVDPKRRDFSIYRGAALIKPNRGELGAATGLPCDTDAEAEVAAAAAIARTGAAILLTRSEQGLSHFAAGETPLHLRTAAKDVFDVSGAGDTVMALAALGLAARLPIPETMRLANLAAGIVVSKTGTAVVAAHELDAALEADQHRASPAKGALCSLEEAVQRREEWRRRGLTVGFTNGCYDLIHPGHVSLLGQAAAQCDRLIVAINTDASVRRLKGPTRPVQGEAARATVLGAMNAVDLVVLFEEDTPAQAIAALRPDLLVKGADYTEAQVVGADTVRAGGGRVMLVPTVGGQSTTAMIRRAANG